MLSNPVSLILPTWNKAGYRGRNFFEGNFPEPDGEEQRQRPPPVAETGSCCWGRGLQDASATQGTKQMQGAATRTCRMTLLETLALLTFMLGLLSLIVDVVRLTLEVMDKFSQKKNDDSKKD